MYSWYLHTRSSVSLIKVAGDQMKRDKRKYFFTRAGGRICRHKDTCTQQVNIWIKLLDNRHTKRISVSIPQISLTQLLSMLTEHRARESWCFFWTLITVLDGWVVCLSGAFSICPRWKTKIISTFLFLVQILKIKQMAQPFHNIIILAIEETKK